MPDQPARGASPAFRKAAGEVSPETLARVREFLVSLANLAANLRIYPPEHASNAGARADIWSKLKELIETHWEFELAVKETAFLYAGEIVYSETNLLKSLPNRLFENGLRSLTFRRGLTEAEFGEFLGILRRAALAPPEEKDIVGLLWERDFENIGYLDSDDYLEAKIGAVDRRPWEKPVDPAVFSRGRIDLLPADIEAIVKNRIEAASAGAKTDAADADLNLTESRFLESAFGAERSTPAESSFLDLFFDLLCLEDRPSSLASLLQFADKHHQELVRRNDFAHAGLLLARLDDLRPYGASDVQVKSQDLEHLAYRIKDSVSLASLKEEALSGRIDDPAAFFAYLERIGPRAVPLAADLFEEREDGGFRSAAFSYLEGVGRRNLDVLAGLARDSMPFLSKGIVYLLGRSKDRRAVPYLARFKDSKLKAVRLEAVKALTGIGDDLALRVARSFETDPDPEVREAARAAAGPAGAD
ncbi:MAG: HEAT repeat domain-containing protein [Acidobacteriota bacterium]|nr:HEAT repeat domain-containing protein [Acidobacteriota bacterium]